MDRHYIDSNNIIERYLLGQLSESEACAFEDAFAFDDELLAEIEKAEQLIVALRAADRVSNADSSPDSAHIETIASDTPAGTEDDAPTHKKESLSSGFWLPLSIAANFVLGLIALSQFFSPDAPTDGTTTRLTASQVNLPSLELEFTRSSSAPRARLNATDDWVVLAISGSAANGNIERLRLTDERGQVALEESNISRTHADPFSAWTDWLVHGSQLTAGAWRLDVESRQSDGELTTRSINFLVCDSSTQSPAGCQ